ncbi:MAG: efflux RND transporter periplasmic adaptor subunit [Acidobacteria bacterium]|nr:efflux RND transporter periplasmic adaptor subunit [Acidobacteriota bacterium]
MKKLSWIVVAVLIVAALFAVRMKRLHEKSSEPLLHRPLSVVEVATVRSGSVGRVRHVTGTVIAGEEARVAPRIMARILEVRGREGDTVHRGQILAVLDSRELEDTVAQAGAALASAREAVAAARAAWEAQRDATNRDRVLHDAGALSDEQWEGSHAAERAANARLEAARAELEITRRRRDQARTRRGYSLLKAPFDGKITARLADPGDLAVPGKPVLVVARENGLRVRAQLPVADLSILAVGDPVSLGTGGSSVTAQVSRIVPATGTNGLAAFEADISNAPKTFVPGATVGVDVRLRQVEGLVIPIDALLEGENGSWVFLVKTEDPPGSASGAPRTEWVVHPVQVRVLARSVQEAVVEGGVAEGQRVVVGQPSRLMMLADGMKVHVASPPVRRHG